MVMTCNATDRAGGRLRICEKPLDHEDDHRDGEHTWPREQSKSANARILDA